MHRARPTSNHTGCLYFDSAAGNDFCIGCHYLTKHALIIHSLFNTPCKMIVLRKGASLVNKPIFPLFGRLRQYHDGTLPKPDAVDLARLKAKYALQSYTLEELQTQFRGLTGLELNGVSTRLSFREISYMR